MCMHVFVYLNLNVQTCACVKFVNAQGHFRIGVLNIHIITKTLRSTMSDVKEIYGQEEEEARGLTVHCFLKLQVAQDVGCCLVMGENCVAAYR